jgi:hypothetical protein
MKHIGKMKNNSARIVVVYRTLPGDPNSALVVGTQGLQDAYHDSLMSLVQDDSAQTANELADILSVRRFPDGSNMLQYLHGHGHLKKVPTKLVLMTPSTKDFIQLDELNKIIAEQKGVSIDELAVTDGNTPNVKKSDKTPDVVTTEEPVADPEPTTAVAMRSKADRLFKEAQRLRKQADALDPPKSKKKVVATVE